jgi:prepilin-type N-terminal cleavage/methylation domain-containing protein
MSRIRRLAAGEQGYTFIELLQVMVIMALLLAGLTTVFVQASNSELDMNRRFQAQQAARVAVDRMRRELHCARAVTPTGNSSSITVTLPAQCPTAGGTEISVVYDTQQLASGRYALRRAGIRIADYVRIGNVFTYTAPSSTSLGKLRVELPINIQPPGSGSNWSLVGDMVLRNTTRSP